MADVEAECILVVCDYSEEPPPRHPPILDDIDEMPSEMRGELLRGATGDVRRDMVAMRAT